MHFVNFPFSIFTFCISISHFAHFYVVYFAKLLKNISTFAFTYSLCGESCYRLGILFLFSVSPSSCLSLSLFICVHSSGSLLCVLWNVCYVRLLWNLHKMQMMPTEQSTPAATAAAAEGKRKRWQGIAGAAVGVAVAFLVLCDIIFIKRIIGASLAYPVSVAGPNRDPSPLPFPIPHLPSSCKWAAAAFCFCIPFYLLRALSLFIKKKYVKQLFYSVASAPYLI